MSKKIWLLEIAALDNVDAATTLRFASGSYIDAEKNHYDKRLKQPGLFTIKASGQVVPGSARSAVGISELVNTDGGLDYLVDYAVDGRAASLKLVNDDTTVTTVVVGTVESMRFEGTLVQIKLRDPYTNLNKPHPYDTYDGTNTGTYPTINGIDGVVTDLKGKRRPRAYGKPSNCGPLLVNTGKVIYEASDLTTATITAVYDKGVALTPGAAYADLTALQTTAPAAGEWRSFQGYFRVGAAPTGTVTCDVSDSVFLLGDVMNKLVVEAGYTMSGADVTVLNTLGEVGIYLTDMPNTTTLLDLLANSMGGYWSFNALGVVRAMQLIAPASPTLTIYNYQIVKLTRQASGAGLNGLPVWRVTVNADKVETVQTEVAASVNGARVSQQFRQAIATTAATLTRHPLAAELVVTSALRSLTDGQTLATRLAALFAGRRDWLLAEARLDAATTSAIAIGTVLIIKSSKLGYSAGRTVIVVGYTLDARTHRISLDLWG